MGHLPLHSVCEDIDVVIVFATVASLAVNFVTEYIYIYIYIGEPCRTKVNPTQAMPGLYDNMYLTTEQMNNTCGTINLFVPAHLVGGLN